ncbi:hypothetical protein llap_12644 [Limosa lapponica baueri]|uniref:Uncharacterized protein n=1 Tax=Limosa lapponica baueri TaxID=1758121 RepID=A0A2I0TTB8_LIMLA|nr:hypothetical protein llap_12644 [Limosa lapponica baueri]
MTASSLRRLLGQKVIDTTAAFRRISKGDWTENQKEGKRHMKVKHQPRTNLFSLVGQETAGLAARFAVSFL